MNHQWEQQPAGDVRCLVCGIRALTPNNKECAGEAARAAQKVKPCCGDKTNTLAAVGAVTRPSCLECVEKHLGAAWVLLAETRDGYAYRLRAIGHLHEAEDESQQWPELHNAIRDARKAYQSIVALPDFEALAKIVASIHLRDINRPPSKLARENNILIRS